LEGAVIMQGVRHYAMRGLWGRRVYSQEVSYIRLEASLWLLISQSGYVMRVADAEKCEEAYQELLKG
jgi:hypothetical protein